MIGSFVTRGLVLILGYAYPAYECFKTVEMNKPEIEQLRFWCQYWILAAGLTVCERIGDMFIGWVPMYCEAKLAFFVYLWYPKTKGTIYVYDSFFRPYIAKHETEIDRNLLELRTRAGDMIILYWQKAASYGQTRVFEILHYVASQSSLPRAAQSQLQGTSVPNPKSTAPSNQGSAATTQPQNEQPFSPSSTSTSESEEEEDVTEEAEHSDASKAATTPAAMTEQKTTSVLTVVETSKTSNSNEESMQIDSVPPTENDNAKTSPQQNVLEDTRLLTRARLTKTRTVIKP